MGATNQANRIRTRCARNDCESGMPPTFAPMLHVFDAFKKELAALRVGGIVACEVCAMTHTDPEDLGIRDEIWESVCKQIASRGMPRPVRKLSKLVWDRLADVTPEFQAKLTMELRSLIGSTLDAQRIATTGNNAQAIAATLIAVGVDLCSTAGVPVADVVASLRQVANALDSTIASDGPEPCMAITEHEERGYACTKAKGHEDGGDLEHACEFVDTDGHLRVEHRWAGDSPSQAVEV